MNIHKKLYKWSGSKAAGKQRKLIWFVTVDPAGSFTAYSGQEDGKLTPKVTRVKQKNVGKANETSLAEQAHLEAEAKWLKKRDRELYKEDLNDGKPPIFVQCMLAMDATGNKHRINWVARNYVTQPKLNGVRFMAHKPNHATVVLTSRKGKTYNVPHISEALFGLLTVGAAPLDGELYLGENFELGDVTKALKYGNPGHDDLQAHLFDIAHASSPFHHRYAQLQSLFDNHVTADMPVKLVPTATCSSLCELDVQHDFLASQGFEGIMLRDLNGLYDFGEKNVFMFKYKKFQDAEYEILGVIPDKDNKGGLFVLKTDNGTLPTPPTVATFTCKSKGTDAQREHVLDNPHEYVGKLLTVRFSELLKTGVPEFNRGILKDGMIAVRDYE